MGVMETLPLKRQVVYSTVPLSALLLYEEKRWDYWTFSKPACSAETTRSVQCVELLVRSEPGKDKYAVRTLLARTSTLV
jgi:hypothetical protein